MSRMFSLLLALALAATACGGGAATPETPIAPSESGTDLPAVEVLDVATGDTVNVASLAPLDQPLLLWFYAPH